MKRILVVGSLNMDIVIETPCMPKAGETIAVNWLMKFRHHVPQS